MELVESMFKYAFVFDLVIAAILFIIVTSWLRLKRKTFLRLMMTTSPQYDFIKGQLMTFLTENMQILVMGIITSINREGDRPDTGLDEFFRKLYGRFDLVRRSRFGRIKFERALHFAIKAKLVSHPLDLMGTRWVFGSVFQEKSSFPGTLLWWGPLHPGFGWKGKKRVALC